MPAPHHKPKRAVLITVLALAFVFVASLFALSHPQHDFIEYWTASHLVVHGGNPYSLPEMFKMQRTLGWEEPVPLMFVCPPWALPLIAPLGIVSSYGAAWLVWSALLIFAAALSSRWLMDLYFADLRIPEISDTAFYRSLFAFTFYPVLLALKFSQISPLLLLGVAGFLHFTRRERPILAGLMLSLTLLKPQLLVLVWIALLFDSVRRHRWKSLLASAAAVLLATGLALLLDSHAFQQYRELLATPYLEINPSGMLAIVRRLLKSHGTYWMQFVPPVLGFGWFVFYWRRHRNRWEWLDRMPALVTASILTTAYGWVFDQAVLGVAVIAIAAQRARPEGRLPWNLIVIYTALNGGLMLLMAVPPLTFIPAPVLFAVILAQEARPANPGLSALANW